MKTGNIRNRPGRATVMAAVVGLVLLAGTLPGWAQTTEGHPQDLEFEIVNATTNEPGTVDRLVIEYITARRNNVADFEPDGSAFVARGVPVITNGKYIVTVWKNDVPYWWSKRGRELVDGPVVLHVFDTVTSLEGISFSGLNLVVRRQESILRLEYMLQVANEAQPQVTANGFPSTFEIALPRGASEIEASYTRGPDPTPIKVDYSGKKGGLSVPLTPGQNQIRLEAVVPWTDGMEIPVGSNLPVNSWSILASPEWLEVGSTDIEENDSEKVVGFRRFAGFPLESGETITLRLTSGEQAAGPEEDLFTKEAPAEKDAATDTDADAKDGGSQLPLILMGVVIIVIVVAVRRRK